MARAIRCIVAFAVAWSFQAGVSFAEADWLDRASGFGPSKGFYVHYRFLCVTNPSANVQFVWLDPFDRSASMLNAASELGRWIHAKASRTTYQTLVKPPAAAEVHEQAAYDCKSDGYVRGYFELLYRRAVSLENDVVANRSQVHLSGYEVAYVDRFSEPFDFSMGVGWNNIDARPTDWFTFTKLDRADQDAFTSFRRVFVTPSLIWSPFASAGKHPYAHLIRVQAGATVFLRGFHAREFCNTGVTACVDPAWQTHGADVIPMVRFMIDASQLWKAF